MEDREARETMRRLDPACASTRVRLQALAGFPQALAALLGDDASVHERRLGSGGCRAVVGSGPAGAVACVAVPAGEDAVDAMHTVDPAAAGAVGELLDPPLQLAVPPGGGERLSARVDGLLRALDAAAGAASRHAADRLHDGPLQALTVAQLLIESSVSETDPSAGQGTLRRGLDTLRSAIVSSRRLMTELLGAGEGAGVRDP